METKVAMVDLWTMPSNTLKQKVKNSKLLMHTLELMELANTKLQKLFSLTPAMLM